MASDSTVNGRRTVSLGVRVEPELLDELDFVANLLNIRRNELVRLALRDYVDAAYALEKA